MRPFWDFRSAAGGRLTVGLLLCCVCWWRSGLALSVDVLPVTRGSCDCEEVGGSVGRLEIPNLRSLPPPAAPTLPAADWRRGPAADR